LTEREVSCTNFNTRNIITQHLEIHCVVYLLTPWCRVLLENLTGSQLVKKFPAFHGTRKFITALTSVRHLSLSWASPSQSINPHPTSWRSIPIVSTHLRLDSSSPLGLDIFSNTLFSIAINLISSARMKNQVPDSHTKKKVKLFYALNFVC